MTLKRFRELTGACRVARVRIDEALRALAVPATGKGKAGQGTRRGRGKRRQAWHPMVPALRALLRDSADVVFREVTLGGGTEAGGIKALVVYIDGMVDKEDVEERIILPLMSIQGAKGGGQGESLSWKSLAGQVITAGEVRVVQDLDQVVDGVLSAKTAVLVQGVDGALLVANAGFRARPLAKPAVEFSLRGPQDSFSEVLRWNTALIRRRIRDPGLRVKQMKIGRRSRTDVAVLYLEGVVNPALVAEVEKRLGRIDIDGILDSTYLAFLTEDYWWSPFPTVDGSERPDTAVASLLEGRVVILTDNSPFALIVPVTFDGLFHSPEDSYDRWLPVSLLRLVRFIGTFVALLTPSLYVAMVSFHPGLLPARLAISVATSREGVAFPVLIEALIAQVSLELLKEAGFRIPSPVGQIFGVVGGLVLGDLGVRAGIFSELMVLIIAVTAVASFSVPTVPLGTIIRLMGLPLLFSASLFGLYGVVMGLMLIAVHLMTMSSFGVPYLVPYSYYPIHDLKDTLGKGPLVFFRRRPSFLATLDSTMQKTAPQSSEEVRR